MSEDDGGRRDPVKHYGPWAAVAGFLFGGGIIWLLFAMADPFS